MRWHYELDDLQAHEPVYTIWADNDDFIAGGLNHKHAEEIVASHNINLHSSFIGKFEKVAKKS